MDVAGQAFRTGLPQFGGQRGSVLSQQVVGPEDPRSGNEWIVTGASTNDRPPVDWQSSTEQLAREEDNDRVGPMTILKPFDCELRERLRSNVKHLCRPAQQRRLKHASR